MTGQLLQSVCSRVLCVIVKVNMELIFWTKYDNFTSELFEIHVVKYFEGHPVLWRTTIMLHWLFRMWCKFECSFWRQTLTGNFFSILSRLKRISCWSISVCVQCICLWLKRFFIINILCQDCLIKLSSYSFSRVAVHWINDYDDFLRTGKWVRPLGHPTYNVMVTTSPPQKKRILQHTYNSCLSFHGPCTATKFCKTITMVCQFKRNTFIGVFISYL